MQYLLLIPLVLMLGLVIYIGIPIIQFKIFLDKNRDLSLRELNELDKYVH